MDRPGFVSREERLGHSGWCTLVEGGHVMLDEKAADTAHVAIGRNTGSCGGDNEAAISSEPRLQVDGRAVEL